MRYLFLLTSVKFYKSALTEGATPVPIPNTAVKPLVVDGTVLATVWESRTALDYFKARVGNTYAGFVF